MTELIFSIKDIFNDKSLAGCLKQYDSSFYHIPAYQRGYKWSSERDGAVTVLLNDLKKAYLTAKEGKKKEYFLQYITLKKISLAEGKGLEVIDGQQRLTTLSVILSSLAIFLDEENISANKLHYAIRENFFDDHIYKKSGFNSLVQKSWHQTITENKELNKQDIFYLFKAAEKCNSFFGKELKNELLDFYNYLLNEVKLIVNSIEPHIESEAVFKNLNSNKVPLTEAELIKALIITSLGRNRTNEKITNFHEILEIRSKIGRVWDEISSWVHRPEIKSFYFNNKKDAMHELLKLTAASLEEQNKLKIKAGEFPLFNAFLDFGNIDVVFKELLEIKNTLDDWFTDPLFYNLIGFHRFAKKSGNNNRNYLVSLLSHTSKTSLLAKLEDDKEGLLKQIKIEELNYEESPENIHHILLALNVFIEGWQKDFRFNFYAFEQENWSLEHIFPQTPEGKKNILSIENKLAIKEILESNLTPEIEMVLDLDERDQAQKEIYYKALKAEASLNSIGNMCLMTGGDNASNGNKFFPEKRNNILNLIQKGSFVPKHTFDVFSKMFEDADTARMNVWSKRDMESHSNHIKNVLKLKLKESKKDQQHESR
ncbi:DUF262 domain-containing protein [Salinimicrobium sp. HB62]|uniref:DUF262 domain-containing protein n=1 Tax=Salinimicrobium sp. HB62 TaxID=3077781 RepID=UPI002D77D74A|nr:DUF262 domain-containing protein [Salinimicrobium sp. HB62]